MHRAAGGIIVAIAICTFVSLGTIRTLANHAPPPSIQISADRCGGCSNVQTGEDATLLMDVDDVAPVGISPHFEAELVDSSGRRLALAADLTPSGGRLAYAWSKRAPGIYFLRLRESGTLRREYEIRVP